MRRRQPSLPNLWLISDARNDAALEAALRRLPRGSGFVFRHYHLDPAARRVRFEALLRIARARGHVVVLAGIARPARRWGADGSYGAPDLATARSLALRLAGGPAAQEELPFGQAGASSGKRNGPYHYTRFPLPRGRGLFLATAHSLREIAAAHRAHADAILLSPVFPTRSHPGARALGPPRFRLLAARSRVPVIALGGMDRARARRLQHAHWAAIDGLATA